MISFNGHIICIYFMYNIMQYVAGETSRFPSAGLRSTSNRPTTGCVDVPDHTAGGHYESRTLFTGPQEQLYGRDIGLCTTLV